MSGATLSLAERQRLLSWLYRERLLRPIDPQPDLTRRPDATQGKGTVSR